MFRFAALLLFFALAFGCASTGDESAAPPEDGELTWQHIDFKGIMRGKVLSPEEERSESWQRQIEFFAELEDKPVASMADAVRAFILYRGGFPWGRDIDALAAELASERIIKPEWPISEKEPLTTGRVSYMVYQACRMRGGFWLLVLGPTERYCYKEAVYQDIVPPGSLHRYVPGIALLDIISQCDVYTAARNGDA